MRLHHFQAQAQRSSWREGLDRFLQPERVGPQLLVAEGVETKDVSAIKLLRAAARSKPETLQSKVRTSTVAAAPISRITSPSLRKIRKPTLAFLSKMHAAYIKDAFPRKRDARNSEMENRLCRDALLGSLILDRTAGLGKNLWPTLYENSYSIRVADESSHC